MDLRFILQDLQPVLFDFGDCASFTAVFHGQHIPGHQLIEAIHALGMIIDLVNDKILIGK